VVANPTHLTKESTFAAVLTGIAPALATPVRRRFATSLGLALGFTVVIFWQTAWAICVTWYSSRTFSHGFLVVPIFVYLVWIRRHRITALNPQPTYWVAPILVLLTFIWLAGNLGDIRVIEEFTLVAMLEGIMWMLLGTAFVRALWFPLIFLFFTVPFGQAVIGPLQDFTAHFAVAALRLSHVPVVLENRTIWVPSGPWVVAETCSGVRYLISSLVLGLVYASLVYRSQKRRVLFVLASVAVPIVANGIRGYGVILLAYLTDNRLAVGVDHIIYGWLFFTIIQFLLFSVGLIWREELDDEAVLINQSKPASDGSGHPRTAVALVFSCALICVSLGPLIEKYIPKPGASEFAPELTLVANSPWRQTSSYDRSLVPNLHPRAEFNASFISAGDRIEVYIATYSKQRGVELVQNLDQLWDPKVWSEVGGGSRRVLIRGLATTVRWEQIQSVSSSRVVWTWYSIDGTMTSNPFKVKLLQTKARLLAPASVNGFIVISADYGLAPAEATAKLQDFLNHVSILQTAQPSGISSTANGYRNLP
jgi:exosortase A